MPRQPLRSLVSLLRSIWGRTTVYLARRIADGVYHTAEEFDKFLEVAGSEDRASGTKSFKDDTLNFLSDLAEELFLISFVICKS